VNYCIDATKRLEIASAAASSTGAVNESTDPNADTAGLQERYGAAAFGHLDVNVSNFDGQPELTEMDAIIAYLQVLGTMVDFTTFIPDPTR
jgi:cytochrome c oxidase cbb3-type subunit 2